VVSLFDEAGKSYYDVRALANVPPGYASLLNSTVTKGQIGAIGAYQECSDKVVSRHISTMALLNEPIGYDIV
jgi:hypothetical protein